MIRYYFVDIFIQPFHHAEQMLLGPQMLHSHIKNARERAGLTLTEAAVRMGIGKATLSRLEAGTAPIAAGRLPVFARVYQTTVAALIDNRVSARPREPDYEQIVTVVEMVEQTIQSMGHRPSPKLVGRTVAEVIRLAEDDRVQRLDGQFDPQRYRGIVIASLGGGIEQGNPFQSKADQ